MDNITWQGNSKKMYDTILAETPLMFRGFVKQSVADWIEQGKVTVVTEETVFQAVDEIAPLSLANKIKPELEILRS